MTEESQGGDGRRSWHLAQLSLDEKADWPIAVVAWVGTTVPILEGVAATYGGSITYEQLRHQLFDETGYRTRSLLSN